MKKINNARVFASLLVVFCLVAAPLTALAKKGEKNYKRGLQYEAAQQWEQAAQEFTLAVAADPSNVEYQLHYRRAVFNASQSFMQKGRALAEQRDYIGAYNAFRQAYGYDPVNELALSEMERMLRLQREREGNSTGAGDGGNGSKVRPTSYREGTGGKPAEASNSAQSRASTQDETVLPPARAEQLLVVKYTGDLKTFIRLYAEKLNLNVIFDGQSFRTPRSIEVNLTDVTTSQALDLVFIQEGLFFQKLNRRTILVADQNRRAQYQQLAIRTFYLANIKPEDAQRIITNAIPPNQGRPQTIVLPDKDTNSITIRDTSENLRLIGEILQSIDKDRAEVVMDVAIYEVSRSDLLQLGNQLGTGDSSGFFSLGGSSGVAALAGSRQVASTLTSVPTALGAAFVVPASLLTAFQRKDRTKLVASTQIHAFNNEESSARIGQRVPVQTAQTFPFSNVPTQGQPGTGTTGGVFSGGFPVIQYEPTGLTLNFTPQVFPNLDVQVKMKIESKDILNAGSLTPTFTERTITGTARIQNNRTMMLASVAQDTQSNGRRGLPILGLIPILGRLFTSPTRNSTQIDIVIAVTPRVLRAPAITPTDERERPSGTLQTPTSGSLEAMIQEVEREEQLAAARRRPTNVVVQLPDGEPPPAYVPAPKSMMTTAESASAQPQTEKTETASAPLLASAVNVSQPSNALAEAIAKLTGDAPPSPTSLVQSSRATPRAVEAALPLSVPSQPRSQMTLLPPAASAFSADTAPGNLSKTDTPAQESLGNKLKNKISVELPAPVSVMAEARLIPVQQEMRVGEKQRMALVLDSKEALGNTIIKLRFDARQLAVRGVTPGVWSDVTAAMQPIIMQAINPAGTVSIAISPQAGTTLKAGANVVLFLELEAVGVGESIIGFDSNNAHVVTSDNRGVKLQFVESRLTVK